MQNVIRQLCVEDFYPLLQERGKPFFAEVLLNLLKPLVDPAFTYILMLIIRKEYSKVKGCWKTILQTVAEKQHSRLYLCSRLSWACGSEIPHSCIIENSISCILGNCQYCFPALSSIGIISFSPSAFLEREFRPGEVQMI